MNRFIETATSSHCVTSLIREVQIHYHVLDEETDDSPEDIEPVLSNLVNLESLVIRTSWFDTDKAKKMQLLCRPQETLSALRSVILSLDYGHEWEFSVGSYGYLLHHPGLEKLTIAGAAFQMGTLDKLRVPFRSTSLQALALLNCALNARHLKDMLLYPLQLKHFTMKGQEERYIYGPFRDFDRRLYIDALRSHASSLETLDIDLQYGHTEEPIDLSEFSALLSLTISPRMLIGDNQEFWLKDASTSDWAKLLPSNLQHLTFRHDCAVFPLIQMYEAVREGYIKLRSLTCQIASNTQEDGSPCYDEGDLDTLDPQGVKVFRSPDEVMSDVSPDGTTYAEVFQAIGIDFSVIEVPRTETLTGNDSCPCPCWTYKHRVYNGEDYSWW
ncbi:hypothetical protein N7541_005330 [Penicillium brevicompactum]|uniref:Uncharacterized protein n=1 Tax=Penicillium brevicompactum TaxID=5074 RepID=A0A9W9RDT3_PENBR|nr:hypothetical protein N7541_005330 [Penicillium brevicompactum]